MDKLKALAVQIEAHGDKISDLITDVENHINTALSGASERLIALPGTARLVLKDDDSLEVYLDNNSCQGQIKLEHCEDGINPCAGTDEIINKAYPDAADQDLIKQTLGLIKRYMEEHMEDLDLEFNVSDEKYNTSTQSTYDLDKEIRSTCEETKGLKGLVADAANKHLENKNLAEQIRFDKYLTIYFNDEPITLCDDNESNIYESMEPNILDYLDMDTNNFKNDYEKRSFVRNLSPDLYKLITLIDFDLENMGYYDSNGIPADFHKSKESSTPGAITKDNNAAYEKISAANKDLSMTSSL